jgi:hypothetical protein
MAIARAAALWSAPLPALPSTPPPAAVPSSVPPAVPPAVSPAVPPVAPADDLPLAGLLDLLERADAVPRRRRPVRAAVSRHPAARRALRPLPTARPVPVPRPRPARPSAAPVTAAAPAAAPAAPSGAGLPARAVRPGGSRLRARVRATVRRLAMWGAGPDGAHAAWPTPPVVVPPAGPGLVRRLAMWGAGPGGAHLAWGAPRPPAPAAPVDPPAPGNGAVVLTELPSTPTIASAVPSPTAASSPGGPARPLPRPRVAVPALAPAGWPARPAAGRALARAPDLPPSTGGTVRTRGDPAPHRARGSPRPPPAPD